MGRRRGYIEGGATAGSPTGGTEYTPGVRPSPKPVDPYITPPPLAFDPAIEASRREAQRGLEDTESDVFKERHYAHKDLGETLRNIRTESKRKFGDINRSAFRGQQKIGFQEQDATKRAGRANQDFDTQLSDIARQFKQLGHRQGEAANAAGVYDQGTLGASQAARSQNQSLAEAPIATARTRLNEDLGTTLSRLGIGRSQIGEDQTRSQTRLAQDRDRQVRLERRKTGRQLFGLHTELQRARREGKIKEVDFLTKEIYNARAEHPSAFKAWSAEHQGVVQGIKNGNSGGTSTPNKKKKGGR